VLDHSGSRVHKFNNSGNHQWSLGKAGMHYIRQGEDVFSWPRDVGVDGSDNLWVVDSQRVTQYNSSGVYQQVFPKWDDDPWDCGDDNGHFCEPSGIAFDSSGWMYVSDDYNHRVQVFKFTGGEPVYYKTIGQTGNPGNGNDQFNHPGQLAIDSSDNLYVADRNNARIQKCVYDSSPPEKWDCTTFHGTGSFGSGDNQLDYVEGLGISGNTLYIADSGNNRVKSCNLPNPCGTFANDVDYPSDVAVITSIIRILISVERDYSVHEYNDSGDRTGIFAGTGGVPYLTDSKRLNRPWGLAIGHDGSLYAAEQGGNRLVKMDLSGNQINSNWPIGTPGVGGHNNDRFIGPEGNLAINDKGHILVPDTWNHRVQVFNPVGNHIRTLGKTGEKGDDNTHFNAPAGVAVDPLNGDILVADRRNHRVQVFDSSYKWKATLGQTGNPGNGNNQFEDPYGVFVDKDGDIYVADKENHRVQVFSHNRKYKATLGVTDDCDQSFDHICGPLSVLVDNHSRIFVTEEWENKVRVFDDQYNYLTTIGGGFNSTTGEFRNPSGLALDKHGTLYVADSGNHRVQKFAPGVFGWQQSNLDGFGNADNIMVSALKSFNPLVAGVFNGDNGAELWKLENGNWTSLMKGGFGNSRNVGITELVEFKNKYYAATSADETNGGEIWRSANLSNWEWVVKGGFGDTDNGEINRLTVFKDMLYATTWSWNTSAHGGEIWRSGSGDKGSWNRVVSDGFGDSSNEGIVSLLVFKDLLYASTANRTTGGEVWRSSNGTKWDKVSPSGLGDGSNQRIVLAVYMDSLYGGTHNRTGAQTGGELWRCDKCDGTDWVELTEQKGFGDPHNWGFAPVGVPGNTLYVFTDNRTTGLQIWMAADGENFVKVGPDGFGDSRNYFPGGFAVHDGKLFVGTGNWGNAAEIWFRKGFYYLPTILKE